MRLPPGTPLERCFNIFFMFLFSGMAYALVTWRLGFSGGSGNLFVTWAEEVIEMVFGKILGR